MATCKVINTPDFELRLTSIEASTLLRVCLSIGGDMSGPRGCIDSILTALQEAGCPQRDLKFDKRNTADSLYFKDHA